MKYLINLDESKILEDAGDRIPIGLLSIASNTPDTKIFDLNHVEEDDFLLHYLIDKPERVGISVYTSAHYKEALRMAEKIRKHTTFKTELVAGGYHATAMPESLFPQFDKVIVGEGENVFNGKLERITIADEPRLDLLENLDYSLLDMTNYGMHQSGKRTATVITSRGCPYACSFCGKMSRKVRFEPEEKIHAQLDKLKREGFDAVYFVDDVFTLNKDRMKNILETTKKSGMSYRVTSRSDLLDEEKMDILKETGCDWLSLGIESGNDEILKKSNKKMTTTDNYNAVKMAGERGIKTKGFFIIGLPGETEETARETIEFAKFLKPFGLNQADFYFLSAFPGTPIWKDPKGFGIEITDKDYSKYLQAGKQAHCYINTEELKASRIEELVREAKEEWQQ